MTRAELIRMLVLNSIADDYENLEQIAKDVTRMSTECGVSVSTDEILNGLSDLIESNLATAYRFDRFRDRWIEFKSMPERSEIGSPRETNINDAWFWVTERGKEMVIAHGPDWPFDDDDKLRAGWKPPVP
jgi:hypothetical protein